MSEPQLLSTDPNAGRLLSTDPNAGRAPVPDFKASNETDASGNPVVRGAKDFLGELQSLNPAAINRFVQSAFWHPIDTAEGIYQGRKHLSDAAKEAFGKGDYVTGSAKLIEWLMPLLGERLSQSGDYFQQGEYAKGAGAAVDAAIPIVGPKVLENARIKVPVAPKLANPNAAEAAAAEFGASRGVPIDAATATGNRFVRSVQGLADHSPFGSGIAERAKATQGAALSRVAGDLADEAHPVAVTGEQAGQGVRDAVTGLVKDLNAQASSAYEALRTIEGDPKHSELVHTAPQGSSAFKSILGKLGAGAEDGRAPSMPELKVMRQIEAELDAQPYTPRLLKPTRYGGSLEHVEGTGGAGAAVYDEILQAAPGTADLTRGDVLKGIQKTLETGEWNNASRGALAVAKHRLRNSGQLGGPLLDPGAPILGARTRVSLPVHLEQVKTALEPLYTRLKREADLIPLQGDKGRALVALDRLLNGPDVAPVSVVDAALGDLKSMARADIPELRSQGQGLAARAVLELDRAVKQAAMKAGKPALNALEEGRAATVAKYQTGDVLESLRAEPVQAYRQAVAPKDSGIVQLRAIANAAPAELPKIARAYLDDLFNQATAEGGFSRGAKLQAEWQKLGSGTKRMLFPSPGQAQALDHFFLLAKKISESPNPSQSALAWNSGAQLALMFTHPLTGIPLVLGSGALSKLLHSTAGVRALTRGLSVTVDGAKASGAARAAALIDVAKAAERAGVLPAAAQAEPRRDQR